MSGLGPGDYEMEAKKRAAKEREEIVSRYKKGESNDEDEDRWEDSAFSVYKVTDRYGFLHKSELPEIPSLEEEKRKQTEVKRQYKWVKMLQKWANLSGTEKLRNRVYKGIPLNLRGDAWRLLLNVADLMKEKPKIYEEMKERSLKQSSDIKQIDMDVNRTYRNHIMFRKRYSIKQQQLFFVLSAYSMYNTEVGYCQGMSQIAALLLMYMSEEEAFWALHSLLYGKKHRMHGFFIPGFPKLLRFQDHHDKILKKFVPRLKKHLDKNEIFASLYTMKWFFQCFLDRSPFPLTLRLWDIYVLEGERVLIAMSYTTLKMHKTNIKKMDMDEIVTFLQERLADNFGSDDDIVVEQLRASMIELKKNKLDLPPAPGDDEFAKLPFGVPVQPTFAQETGIRVPVNERNNSISKSKKSNQKEAKTKETNGNVGEYREKVPEAEPVAASFKRNQEQRMSKRNSSQKSNRKESESDWNVTDLDSKVTRRRSSKKDKARNERSRAGRRSIEKERKVLLPSTSSNQTLINDTKPKPSRESNPQTYDRGEVVFDGSKKRLSREAQASSKAPPHEGDSDKVKIVWKAPTTLHPSTNQNKPPSPRQRTVQVDKTARSRRLSSSEHTDVPSETRTVKLREGLSRSSPRLDSALSIPTVSVVSPSKPDQAFTLDQNRPFSVYDNVMGSMTESELVTGSMTESDHEFANVHMLQLDTSTTSGSIYQTKMEESLENLLELAASLPVSPNSPVPSTSPSVPLSSNSQRHKSLEILDNSYLADDSNLSSLDKVARDLSRSSELLEQEQRRVEKRSAFRKAVEGAGIMQLPKRPSSTALNAALSTDFPPEFDNRGASVVSASDQFSNQDPPTANPILGGYIPPGNGRVKPNGQWKTNDLDFPVSPHSDFESHPVRVNLSAMYRNGNNNNHFSPPQAMSTADSHDYLSPADIPNFIQERRKNITIYNSGHDITESKPHKSHQFSMSNTFSVQSHPSYRPRDPFPAAPNNLDYLSRPGYLSPVNERLEIRPQAPVASPPSYSSSASRFRNFPTELFTDSLEAVRDPNRRETRRKNSATIAVQTEPSNFLGDSSLV